MGPVFASSARISIFRPSRLAVDVVFSAVGLIARYRSKIGMFDSYRPELHYMRGPGPKWREKHARAVRP
jgi:hypothetical protein